MSGQRLFGTTSKLFPYGKYSNDGGNVGETQYHDQSPGNIPTWSQKFVYYIGQEIYDPISAAYYRCIVNHAASDVFANDLALVYWVPMSTPALVTGMRNGLTLTGTFGELGGTLIRNTNIELAGFIFSVADGGIAIASFDARALYDGAGNPSINWGTRIINDAAGILSIDYENRGMNDSSGITSVAWESRVLVDSSAVYSVDYGSRILVDNLATNRLNWNALEIIGTWKYLDGNEALNYMIVSDASGNMTWTNPATFIGGYAWSLDGNTNGVLKYIGTNDAFDFPIYTNGVEAGRILASDQNWGIGLIAPTARLHARGIDALNTSFAFKIDNVATTLLYSITNEGRIKQGPGPMIPTYPDGNVYNFFNNGAWFAGGIYMGSDIENHTSAILPGQLSMGKNSEIRFYSDYGGPGEYNYGGQIYANFTTGLMTVRGGVGGMQVLAGFGALSMHVEPSLGYVGFKNASPLAVIHALGLDSTILNYVMKLDNNVGGTLAHFRNDGFVGIGVTSPSAGTPKLEVRGNILAGPGTATATGIDSVFHAVRTNTGAPNYYSGWQYVFEVGGGVWGIAMDYATSVFQFLATTGATFGFGGGSLGAPSNKVLMYMANGYVGSNTFGIYGGGAGITANFHAVGANQLDTYWTARFEDSLGAIAFSVNNAKETGIRTLTPTSAFDVDGSVSFAELAVIANTVLDDTHYTIYIDADATTQTLPDATTCKGRVYVLKLRVNAVSSATINTVGGNIELNPTYTITNVGGGLLNGITVQSDGTNYNILY